MASLRLLLLSAFGALLVACAQPEREEDQRIQRVLTPAEAAANIEAARGQVVRWGGVILSSTNLEDRTQLEVLAYPLDDDNRPETGAAPLGRFIAVRPGYLETVDYAPGRRVTVTGTVEGTRVGQVGEAKYTYPVVNAERLELWGEGGRRAEPRFRFGVGVGIGL